LKTINMNKVFLLALVFSMQAEQFFAQNTQPAVSSAFTLKEAQEYALKK